MLGMSNDPKKAGKPDLEQRIQDLREEITDADATGLVAGEEMITEAETLLPLYRPSLPDEDLHAALPKGHAAHATIDDLHSEIDRDVPNAQSIHKHVARLRSLPELEAIIANWWDDPQTQRFVWSLNQGGL